MTTGKEKLKKGWDGGARLSGRMLSGRMLSGWMLACILETEMKA